MRNQSQSQASTSRPVSLGKSRSFDQHAAVQFNGRGGQIWSVFDVEERFFELFRSDFNMIDMHFLVAMLDDVFEPLLEHQYEWLGVVARRGGIVATLAPDRQPLCAEMDEWIFAKSVSTYPYLDADMKARSGDPICDWYSCVAYGNRTLMAVADGCNWGPAPREAAQRASRASVSFLYEHQDRIGTLLDAALYTVRSVMVAHRRVFDGKDNPTDAGGTTIVAGMVLEVEWLRDDDDAASGDEQLARWRRVAVLCSVGDCKTFVYSPDTRRAIDITSGQRDRSGGDATDSGGRIGFKQDGYVPDLGNIQIIIHPLADNEYIMSMSDGVHDNLDPAHLGVAPPMPVLRALMSSSSTATGIVAEATLNNGADEDDDDDDGNGNDNASDSDNDGDDNDDDVDDDDSDDNDDDNDESRDRTTSPIAGNHRNATSPAVQRRRRHTVAAGKKKEGLKVTAGSLTLALEQRERDDQRSMPSLPLTTSSPTNSSSALHSPSTASAAAASHDDSALTNDDLLVSTSPRRSGDGGDAAAEFKPCLLMVTLVRARNLAPKDRSGTSDPYCTLVWQDALANPKGKKRKTKVVWETLNPVWDAHFALDWLDPNARLVVQCWDKDQVGSDDFEGELSISAVELTSRIGRSARPISRRFPLVGRGKRKEVIAGDIELLVGYHTLSAQELINRGFADRFRPVAAASASSSLVAPGDHQSAADRVARQRSQALIDLFDPDDSSGAWLLSDEAVFEAVWSSTVFKDVRDELSARIFTHVILRDLDPLRERERVVVTRSPSSSTSPRPSVARVTDMVDGARPRAKTGELLLTVGSAAPASMSAATDGIRKSRSYESASRQAPQDGGNLGDASATPDADGGGDGRRSSLRGRSSEGRSPDRSASDELAPIDGSSSTSTSAAASSSSSSSRRSGRRRSRRRGARSGDLASVSPMHALAPEESLFPADDEQFEARLAELVAAHSVRIRQLLQPIVDGAPAPPLTARSISESAVAHALFMTQTSRMFLQTRRNKRLPTDYVNYPGKMDHTTILCVAARPPASFGGALGGTSGGGGGGGALGGAAGGLVTPSTDNLGLSPDVPHPILVNFGRTSGSMPVIYCRPLVIGKVYCRVEGRDRICISVKSPRYCALPAGAELPADSEANECFAPPVRGQPSLADEHDCIVVQRVLSVPSYFKVGDRRRSHVVKRPDDGLYCITFWERRRSPERTSGPIVTDDALAGGVSSAPSLPAHLDLAVGSSSSSSPPSAAVAAGHTASSSSIASAKSSSSAPRSRRVRRRRRKEKQQNKGAVDAPSPQHPRQTRRRHSVDASKETELLGSGWKELDSNELSNAPISPP
jgi:C2 domain